LDESVLVFGFITIYGCSVENIKLTLFVVTYIIKKVSLNSLYAHLELIIQLLACKCPFLSYKIIECE